MNKSCLIDFKSLKVEQELFHLLHGIVTITELLVGDDEDYPIICAILNSSGINVASFTFDGKYKLSDKYPSIYLYNPYEKAISEVKDLRKKLYVANQENNELYQENRRLEKVIEQINEKHDRSNGRMFNSI